MIIEHFKDYSTMSAHCADIIFFEIGKKTKFNLALPTGNTPLGLYKCLSKHQFDWRHVNTFNLDEYVISKNHPGSYHYYMWENLFSKVNIPEDQIYFPQPGENYDELIDRLGGLDLAILGLGQNGHIAFNEPGSELKSKTRTVILDEFTREVNARFFEPDDLVPRYAVTMGIDTILSADKIIILAQGLNKLDILKKAVWGPITESLPASYLQTHSNVKVYYCD